jgi:hypothetical protein
MCSCMGLQRRNIDNGKLTFVFQSHSRYRGEYCSEGKRQRSLILRIGLIRRLMLRSSAILLSLSEAINGGCLLRDR